MKSNYFFSLLISCLPLFALANTNQQQSLSANKNSEIKNFTAKHLWDAKVEIGELAELGTTKYGTRRMIPITGGSFAGPNISGNVLSGGADFQLTRSDGDTEFLANYMLKTLDGTVIHVTNRALAHTKRLASGTTSSYFRSVIDLEAPSNSPYDYLNHAIYLGTLEIPQLKENEKPYVIIGVYELL